MLTTRVSTTISHANSLPDHSLNRSTPWRSFWVVIGAPKRSEAPEGASLTNCAGSGLLRRSRRLFDVVVIVRHAPVDVVVHVPLDRARGERLLRVDDLLEQRVLLRLL